ncbi:MAG: glycoside hydrolase family 78 protein [Parasporobacterium sp.]|nr:glycoside hydrolase family 78 protein [Parasporobacterium sp.]
MNNPQGVVDNQPDFSWKLRSSNKNDYQKSYRIKVYDEYENLFWDSGVQYSDEVYGMKYKGKKLESHRKYYFNITSVSGFNCERSECESTFTTGNLENKWSALWIEAEQQRKPLSDCTDMWKIFSGMVSSSQNPEEYLNPAVCFRKEIKICKKVKKALLYASSRGIYQLMLDGTIISELLSPGYTVYSKYLEIQQYDVTKNLNGGCHAIGIILADGWFTGKIGLPGVGNQYGETNAAFMQLHIEYEDGSCEEIGSDDSFKWHESAYEYADLMVGERFRQGFLDDSWKMPNYDDSSWKDAIVKKYSTEIFKGRESEPVRVVKKFKAKDIFVTSKNELIVDAGSNIAGVLCISFKGDEGTVVKVSHSEVLDKEGNFFMNILGQNKNQTDVYVCSKNGEVIWRPYFTIHGFRYAKIEGISKDRIIDIDIEVMATDMEKTGSFQCSDNRLNKLQENIFRSQQSNMVSIPTDCPQRERAGWTGDMQIYASTACFNMDVYAFLKKWLFNMRLEQLNDGQIPNIIPSAPSDSMVTGIESTQICSAGWGDACVIIPYTLYMHYGDKKILEENFSMIEKWLKYVEKEASESFVKPVEEFSKDELEYHKYLWNTGFHFGDWLYPSAVKGEGFDPKKTALETKEYVAPLYYANSTSLMAKICKILGKKEKEEYYLQLNNKIKEAYAAIYIDEQGRLPKNLQGLYVLVLAMDVYPQEKRPFGLAILKNLLTKNENRLNTGFLSVKFLLDTLWKNGEKKLAYKVLFNDKCPSWLYEIDQGATSIWESWNAILSDGTRTNVSYNHFAFGCVGEFIYSRILGLTAVKPGYKEVDIKPDFECGLTMAKGKYESIYGKIAICWEVKNNKKILNVELPPGVSGNISISDKCYKVNSGQYRWEF